MEEYKNISVTLVRLFFLAYVSFLKVIVDVFLAYVSFLKVIVDIYILQLLRLQTSAIL